MNIREQLLVEHSKANALFISNYIGDDQGKFQELVELFLGDEYRITQRAGHSLAHVFDNHPHLVDPFLPKLIRNLDNEVNDAVKRNTLRILQDKVIPDNEEGILVNHCFDYLVSNKEPVAIKVFAMTVLGNICHKFPDLKNELKIIIEELMETGTPGIISRGKKVLKTIEGID